MTKLSSANTARTIERFRRWIRRILFPLNSCQQNAILYAAVTGDTREIAELLDGTDPNIRFGDGSTLLTNVIISDGLNSVSRLEVVRLLHGHGVDVDWPGKDGITPLMLASGTGDVELCSTLISLGASVRRRDRNGDTALIWAASTNALASLKLLLDAGADVNHVGGHRRTALMYAARKGALEYVRELLEAGANVSLKDSEGSYALTLACSLGKREVALVLITQEPTTSRELSLLHAASVGFEEIVEQRLREGANLFERNECGFCALDLTIIYAQDSVFQRLLPLYSSKLEALNQALGCAILGDSIEYVRQLLLKGAEPNSADEVGDTPLIHAARRNSVAISEVLIASGANPLQKNRAGDDAIDIAQRSNSSEVFRFLAALPR